MEPELVKDPHHNILTRFKLCYLYAQFPSEIEEDLFREYFKLQRQRAIPRILAIGFMLQAFTVLVPGENNWRFAWSFVMLAIISNLSVVFVYFFIKPARNFISHLAWIFLWAQLLISASRRRYEGAYNELLGWALALQYFTITTLPMDGLPLCIYSVLSGLAYMWVQYCKAEMVNRLYTLDFFHQLVGNITIFGAVSVLACVAYNIDDGVQRASFKTTKRSLRDKLTIEQQSKEQERLLLSVLPEHVAVEMRRDLGLIDTQFKKIYMSRHENVSILYADIVGFTAISSTYSAQDLVAILNELFARFDRLAEKYQQLRIKILGDCYYCISGAPVERPDHAVLCVHMGLSMVKAIKYVQQTTNSPVDMRVGIHTGAVLAGVLGQRQWQFDVYSRDVELANKMESSGMAGRVHISEVTLSFLKDEFEVEPAYGEKREEMLRQAGIKTFFIVRVLKPGLHNLLKMYERQGESVSGEEKTQGEGGAEGDTMSDLRDDDEDSVMSPEGDKDEDSEETKIHNMLVEELMTRDDEKELADATTFCMKFKSDEAEKLYVKHSNPSILVILVPPALLCPAILFLATYFQPDVFAMHLTYAGYLLETLIACGIYCNASRLLTKEKKTEDPEKINMYTYINLVSLSSATLLPIILCGEYESKYHAAAYSPENYTDSDFPRCTHVSYYYHAVVYVLLCVLWLGPSNCARRVCVFFCLLIGHVIPLSWAPELVTPLPSLDIDPYIRLHNNTFTYQDHFVMFMARLHHARHVVMLILITFVMILYDRYLESLDRARHSRAERMAKQAEQASDLRRRNQALVYNVLPPHVAKHFMGAHRHHRDLYSQSYAEVGVLFASMPNFTEFYSEETVNNQGLECLRFLNEVISDFDLLLEDPKFRDIIKIKTISSTYMAASGLNPKRVMTSSDGVLVRWAHLACLVDFALELQRVLAAINEQSFNHFVLRMGVNHGPITAGVIGARKPHYDIWGNTVNVASRMESTGKAGCIQVTEETCHILEKFGYYFEQRGLVAVKGKGQLMTYYLQGRRDANDMNDKQPAADALNVEEPNASDALVANGTVAAQPDEKNEETEAGKPLLS